MHTTKKHNPYELRYRETSPAAVVDLFECVFVEYEGAKKAIAEIRRRWEEFGYLGERQEGDRPWITNFFQDVQKSVLNVEHSVQEFNRYADHLTAKFEVIDQIRSVLSTNAVL